jgi:DNA polymerase III delta prime subunit
MRDEFLWVEKYRPKCVNDCVLPQSLKTTFQQFVDQENIPNLILSGGPGCGKTTVARAMLEQLGCDYIVINGSLNGNIDTLRTDIQNFASTVSFVGGRKYVILDEADYLNPQSTQPALRNFMEEFSKNCGFILTCNFKNRIIEPLQSRCSLVEFKFSGEDKGELAAGIFSRVQKILTDENIEYNKKVIADLIIRFFPDWRRVINELQRYSATGSIDSGILSSLSDDSFSALIGHMKQKDFTNVRKWVAENSDTETSTIFRMFYDQASALLKPHSIPALVLILADYQYKDAFVADHEINMSACMAQVMVECEWGS